MKVKPSRYGEGFTSEDGYMLATPGRIATMQ